MVLSERLPIRIYFYDAVDIPYIAFNPLYCAIVQHDQRFGSAHNLFVQATGLETADFIIPPFDVDYFEGREHQMMKYLNHWSGNEYRHVFYDTRDEPTLFPTGSITLKTSLRRSVAGNNAICIPYYELEDDLRLTSTDAHKCDISLSFIGQLTPLRKKVIDLLRAAGCDMEIRLRDRHYYPGTYYWHRPWETKKDSLETLEEPLLIQSRQREWREEYLAVSYSSKCILCLPGYGLNSFRFYESLAMGIPPVLVSHDCALPFEQQINYDSFCLRFELESPTLGQDIRKAIESLDSNKRRTMGRRAQSVYYSILSPRQFLPILHRVLLRRIR